MYCILEQALTHVLVAELLLTYHYHNNHCTLFRMLYLDKEEDKGMLLLNNIPSDYSQKDTISLNKTLKNH